MIGRWDREVENEQMDQVGSLSLFAGFLIDGSGAPAKHNVLVQIQGGNITSIECLGHNAPRFEAAGLEDLSSYTILPGLVDCHVHLAISGTCNQEIRRNQLQYSFDEVRPLIRKRLSSHLSCGVMALRDGGDWAGHSHRYRTECSSSGLVARLHLKTAGKAWRQTNRYGKLIGRPPQNGLSLAESIKLDVGTDHVKILNSGLNSLTEFGRETEPQFSLTELASAVSFARGQGRRTMIHANGKIPVEMSIRAGCDSIEHGFFMGKENVERIAEQQIAWVPTAFAMKALASALPPDTLESKISAKNLEHQIEQLAYARKTGVRVAVGTDAGGFGIHHGKAFADELKIFIHAGYSVEEAIRCATWEGARLLGVEEDLGRVVPGMPASFIAVRSVPSGLIDALDRVERVYIRGIRIL
jgi:imidazolonepropionase-like amidohydrolase